MKTKITLFLALLSMSYSFCLKANEYAISLKENTTWQSLFTAANINGVFVLCQETNQQLSCTTNNQQRAYQAFIPASTFKIPNALIALETDVIKSPHQIFVWDGKAREFKNWQQDLTLRGAIQYSAVPVFQQFARDIGEQKMKDYLAKFSYGNENIKGGIDMFWLDGELRISALNQIKFLANLYHNTLPASVINQIIVKDTLTSEAKLNYVIRSKTGYTGVSGKIQPGIAWWVGMIEKDTSVYYFAFNMDITDAKKLSARISISREILTLEEIIEAN